jgi:glyoxylase-like metal-dependent hydrolase (beta-lactamase superfamily II)
MRTLPIVAAISFMVMGCGPMTELGLVKPKPSKGGIVHAYTQGASGGHANVYWFDTQAGPLVIDVPLTESEAKKMRKEMIRPYRIYITEADPVRFGGLATMKIPDVPVYSTPAIATDIATHGEQRLRPYHNKYGDDVPTHVDAPTPAVEERAHDLIGEVEVEFIPLGPAAAEASMAVFLPKSGELIAGDVVAGREHVDLTWGRSKVWQDRIAELKALEPRLVYPGHGTNGGPELLDDTLAYIKFFHDTVASKVKQGAPAKIARGDAADIKRQLVAKYPKLGRAELLDRSIPAEYAVQLAELAPAPVTEPGAAVAGGAPAATPGSAPTTASTAPAATPPPSTTTTTSTSTSSSSAAKPASSGASPGGIDDLLGDTSSSSKGKKKKGKK